MAASPTPSIITRQLTKFKISPHAGIFNSANKKIFGTDPSHVRRIEVLHQSEWSDELLGTSMRKKKPLFPAYSSRRTVFQEMANDEADVRIRTACSCVRRDVGSSKIQRNMSIERSRGQFKHIPLQLYFPSEK
eukprot:TRINITY_DN8874_c0_g1_i1.p1 TRINITY_DN8874_c0_g1~~TRINITY_DN8874_c0_g1_i1.p1  ORF type:complete len:133 (+),score=30.77 TRINITY_DN8874_c0_g1_i1:421-819(+)